MILIRKGRRERGRERESINLPSMFFKEGRREGERKRVLVPSFLRVLKYILVI
jgi:hypothetical protein